MGEPGPLRTPLPPIDERAVEAFWDRCVASHDGSVERFTDVGCFGDSVELADDLIALVLHGPKRATAGSIAEYEADGTPMPRVDDRWIACGGDGLPRAVLRSTDVRVGPLSSVDESFAWDEGEGDRTRDDWLRMHRDYYRRAFAKLGQPFDDEIEVVFERFEIDYSES